MDALARVLGETGVGTAIHYPTVIPAQPLFGSSASDYPSAARAAGEVLSLPCFPELTDGEADEVAAGVKAALARLAVTR
jgi:dTDP-4-amino-4,6-dideoxygalactose transaminase